MNTYLPYVIYPTILMATVASIEMIVPQVVWSQSDDIAANAKAVTVLIEGSALGSGVIIDQQDDEYVILTNRHVVEAGGQYFIRTHDRQRYRVTQILGSNSVDLALVTFSSNRQYSVAIVGDSNQLREGQEVYISGYPKPDGLTGERSYRFYRDALNSRLSSSSDGYQLIFSQAGIKGMSGSPIFNENGQLIGIFGRLVQEIGQALSTYGIPINTARSLIGGVNWHTSQQGGQTPQQMGREQYLSMVLTAKTRLTDLSNRRPNRKLKFPAGVNNPISLDILTEQSVTNEFEVIGYVNRQNQPKPFTAPDLLELIDSVAEILAKKENNHLSLSLAPSITTPFLKQQTPKMMAQQSNPLVLDLIVRKLDDGKPYLLPDIEIRAVCRDLLNAILNNKLQSHNYNVEDYNVRRQ